MNKIYELIKTAQIISTKLIGDQSPKGNSSFDDWVEESQHNKELFAKIKNKNHQQQRNSLYNSIDTQTAWKHLSSKINTKNRKIQLINWSMKAAAIILPLIVGGLLFLFSNIDQPKLTTSDQIITPGEQGAILIMNSGESIDLKNKPVDLITEKDGTVIKNANHKLNYSKNKTTQTPSEELKNTLIVARGKEYQITLADGTNVFINSMSKLKFPVQFKGSTREVSLEGEAYFQVKKNPQKPFIVHINDMQIKVLGTSFNVKAYAKDHKIYTTLIEGKVKINTINTSKNSIILKPDQQAILNKGNNILNVRKVNASHYALWKDGIFAFKNQPLIEIIKTLSRWYDFEYEFTNHSLEQIRFEGSFNKYENIDPIWDIIQSTGKVKIKIIGNKIIFM